MSYRNTASFGKRQEYSVISELLKRGFDVYMTLVDDQGIDCVIRVNNKRYLDIQIKARSKGVKNWNLFPQLHSKPRGNFYFIFYTEKDNNFWVIPSKDIKNLGNKMKSGKNIGTISLRIPKSDKGRENFKKYQNDNGFKLLK